MLYFNSINPTSADIEPQSCRFYFIFITNTKTQKLLSVPKMFWRSCLCIALHIFLQNVCNMSEWVHVRRQQDNVWKLPRERVDVLMRFLTRDVTWSWKNTKISGWRRGAVQVEDEDVTLETRGSSRSFGDEGRRRGGGAVNNNTDLCPASCCSTGSAPRLDVPHMFLFERVDNLLLLLHKHLLHNMSRLCFTEFMSEKN